MTQKINSESKAKLVNSKDFRSFIRCYMEIRSSDGKRYGYADLTRSSGFSSRSFLREVVVGSKKLTLDSLHKLIKGMGLSQEMNQFFIYLVELEIESCRTSSKTTAALLKNIEHSRSRVLQKEKSLLKRQDETFQDKNLPKVYAALGRVEVGATTSEIMARTQLSSEHVIMALKTFEEMGLVARKGVRFLAQVQHPSMQHLTNSEVFKKFMEHNLSESLRHIDKDYSKPHCLYFNSYFCLSSKDAPKFKEELRALLLKYVDESDVPEGDMVVGLTCTLR